MSSPAQGGVFNKATDRRVIDFTESVSFDHRLYAHDIAQSIAHAQMLAETELITRDECRQIETALGEIRQQIEENGLPWRAELEDVHMHIEKELTERLGDVGRKLHTGRSREALGWIEEALELDPNFWGSHWALGNYYREQSRYQEAIDEFRQAVALSDGPRSHTKRHRVDVRHQKLGNPKPSQLKQSFGLPNF